MKRIGTNPDKYVDHVYGEQRSRRHKLALSVISSFSTKSALEQIFGKHRYPKFSKGYLFGVKMFEIVGSWPLVFGAYYAISKARKKTKESHETSAEQKGEGHGTKH